ncbi:putative F-box protein At5g44220 [Capsella rubella]|uniref:putative F-box protein At5g44220 n=1 Tax=Capsella rubella TaxID=81985 RepID=UPI000CD584B3|nr:putative F-box protein At5g44220 [Capsella rubella]
MVVKSTLTSSRARVRKKRNKILEDQTTISDLLPTDLLMDILKRLQAKTLVRFLCVSKLWSSIIRCKDFKKLFLTESSNRQHPLFFTSSRVKHGKAVFGLFSLDTHDSGEALIIDAYHKTHLPYYYTNASHVGGLICFGTGLNYVELVVYNTSTRRSITLPKLDSQSYLKHFLIYDPIDGVYKVLCMTQSRKTPEWKLVFQVLTLGIENPWKMIEGAWHTHHALHTHHTPTSYDICINVVLYYQAYDVGDYFVVRFDVRSEKFDLINRPDEVNAKLLSATIMIRYEGKLALMSTCIYPEEPELMVGCTEVGD